MEKEKTAEQLFEEKVEEIIELIVDKKYIKEGESESLPPYLMGLPFPHSSTACMRTKSIRYVSNGV